MNSLLALFPGALFAMPLAGRATTRENAGMSRNLTTLRSLQRALQYYHTEYGVLPHGDQKAIVAALRDSWGHVLACEIDPAGTRITWRSLGPNGRDEAGPGRRHCTALRPLVVTETRRHLTIKYFVATGPAFP